MRQAGNLDDFGIKVAYDGGCLLGIWLTAPWRVSCSRYYGARLAS
jgi:hypothetical protein